MFEHVHIIRCFNCFGFNHFAKECTKKRVCLKCGDEHEQKECLVDIVKCSNCKIASEKLYIKLDMNHSTLSHECPVLKRRKENERKKVNLIP